MDEYKHGTVMPSLEITPQNPDNIVLLGADAQRNIADVSHRMSGILLSGNEELELAICDIIDEVNNFQNLLATKNDRSLFKWFPTSRMTILREYNVLLASFDKIVLGLQLQEAQLLKEISVIKQLRDQLLRASLLLEVDIRQGEEILLSTKTHDTRLICAGSEDTFANRLSKKIEDLQISNIVLQQTQAQLQMLQDAHGAMGDQIVTAITTTIPLWRNQIALLLGFEKVSYEQTVQDKLLEIARANNTKITKQGKKAKRLDFNKLASANNSLVSSLRQMVSTTKKETEIRNNLEMSYFQNKTWR